MLIGIVTDIHEDAERLQIAVKALEKLNCDKLICLGDISGFDENHYSYKYTRSLKYCLDILKRNFWRSIPGNHDLFHLKKFPKYNGSFNFPSDWYELPIDERKRLANGLIWTYETDFKIDAAEEFNLYFENFEDKIILQIDDLKILFTHSVFDDISGILTKKPKVLSDFKEHLDYLKKNQINLGISGHIHPNGLIYVNDQKISSPDFRTIEINLATITQYICPCLADGIQDNGYTILDTKEKYISSYPIKTPRSRIFHL